MSEIIQIRLKKNQAFKRVAAAQPLLFVFGIFFAQLFDRIRIEYSVQP